MNNNSEDCDSRRTQRICELNDQFRTSLNGGAVLFTAGIVALGAKLEVNILDAVRVFNDFNQDNDPFGDHDFGSFEVAGHKVIFKIDYFDVHRAQHSPDPADSDVTERVMTIMLAGEW